MLEFCKKNSYYRKSSLAKQPWKPVIYEGIEQGYYYWLKSGMVPWLCILTPLLTMESQPCHQRKVFSSVKWWQCYGRYWLDVAQYHFSLSVKDYISQYTWQFSSKWEIPSKGVWMEIMFSITRHRKSPMKSHMKSYIIPPSSVPLKATGCRGQHSKIEGSWTFELPLERELSIGTFWFVSLCDVLSYWNLGLALFMDWLPTIRVLGEDYIKHKQKQNNACYVEGI